MSDWLQRPVPTWVFIVVLILFFLLVLVVLCYKTILKWMETEIKEEEKQEANDKH